MSILLPVLLSLPPGFPCQPDSPPRPVCLLPSFQSSSSADPTYLPEPIIIEPRFREQFLIQFNSAALQYEALLSVSRGG